MKYLRALGGFRDMKDAELLQRAVAVMQGMAANPELFPEPVPALIEVQAALDDYQSKLALASQNRGLTEISIKNDSKDLLSDLLQRLAFYVNTQANGNLTTLYASGFEVISPQLKGLLPSTPERLRVGDGPLSGSVRFDFDKVKGSTISYDYCFAITEDEGEVPAWGESTSTRSSVNNVITSLTKKKVIHIRVRAVNAKGASDWTNPVTLIVR